MPIVPPSLDDRSYDDLVAELIARIPAHTPEWTNPVPGDPGRTLLELFAWLTDTLLYRANLIPERQRLAFLRLLGVPLRPAMPARGLLSVSIDEDTTTKAIQIRPGATAKGPASFETLNELTVLPVSAEGFYKKSLSEDEKSAMQPVIDGLAEVYRLTDRAEPYVTTPVFTGGTAVTEGFDMMTQSVDRCLWLALLAPAPELRDEVRRTLGGTTPTGSPHVVSVGVAPSLSVPALFEEIGPRAGIPHVWEISGIDEEGEPKFYRLDVLTSADTSAGLTRRGVVRLVMPVVDFDNENAPGQVRWIRAPGNDVRETLDAGVGDRPPRLDDADQSSKLVAWLRLRPTGRPPQLALSWVGVNSVEIDARTTVSGKIVGLSTGAADQVFNLPGTSIDPASLTLQVDEEGLGYVQWQRVADLALTGPTDRVFVLDAEAGTVSFGDGVRGRVPETGRRVRIARLRAGGGALGNLPPGSITKLEGARHADGSRVSTKLGVAQALATEGGVEAETILEAERRIPSLFRDRDRAVTEADYLRLAADTPGLRLGRVEVMPRFKPHQRRFDVPGVVSVLTLPFKTGFSPPAPRPDRSFLETVHARLDARRPLGTELYVIGCEYVPLGAGVGVSIREGFGRDAVLQAVRDALRVFLWPLAPGGVDGGGWTLGRRVTDREVEVAVAKVPGVREVGGVRLFRRRDEQWQSLDPPAAGAVASLTLEAWQLPELLSVVVMEGDAAPEDLAGVPNPFADQTGVAVPVVPDVC